jgi:hypothetical protein
MLKHLCTVTKNESKSNCTGHKKSPEVKQIRRSFNIQPRMFSEFEVGEISEDI